MTEGVAIRAGWSADGSIRALMSPGLAARVAQADAEDAAAVERAQRAHRAAWEVANERAIDVAAQQLAAAEGIPLREARRNVGRTKAEALSYYSALQDLEDARREAAAAQVMRRAAIDAGLLDVSENQPSERSVQLAADLMLPGETPEGTGRWLRSRFLRRNYRRME
jgi:hypothetical protein